MEEEHICSEYEVLIHCDGETDTYQCSLCGRQWIELCNYEDNFD
jgi:hypothetical protein